MKSSMTKFWIPVEQIELVFNAETVTVFFLVCLAAFVFYKSFLTSISDKRHNNLRGRFRQFPFYFAMLALLLAVSWVLTESNLTEDHVWARKAHDYVLLVGVFFAAYTLIRLFQVVVYCYLFFSNMSHGIPRLIANVLTFFFSVVLFGFLMSHLFLVNIATLATTSAVFSIILGLALQDTIGNLFSGLSLQLDKSLQIGDWVEINTGTGTSWVGQIQEITWRATYLQGFSNEIYMVPNRLIASAKVSFQMQGGVSRRLSHTLRFDYGENFEKIRQVIMTATAGLEGLSKIPALRVLLLETMESAIHVGVFYSIDDFAKRYLIADQVIESIQREFRLHNIQIQVPALEVKTK